MTELRRIPLDFDDYVRQESFTLLGYGRCGGCFREDLDCWEHVDGSVLCEACMRRNHAGDLAVQRLADGEVGGALRGALDGGTHADLVRAAVESILDEH